MLVGHGLGHGYGYGYGYGYGFQWCTWGARTEGSIVCLRGYVFGVLQTFGVRRLYRNTIWNKLVKQFIV